MSWNGFCGVIRSVTQSFLRKPEYRKLILLSSLCLFHTKIRTSIPWLQRHNSDRWGSAYYPLCSLGNLVSVTMLFLSLYLWQQRHPHRNANSIQRNVEFRHPFRQTHISSSPSLLPELFDFAAGRTSKKWLRELYVLQYTDVVSSCTLCSGLLGQFVYPLPRRSQCDDWRKWKEMHNNEKNVQLYKIGTRFTKSNMNDSNAVGS